VRVRCSLLLAIALAGLLASGCGSSHHAALTGTGTDSGYLLVTPGHGELKGVVSPNSRAVRAAISEFLASKGFPHDVTRINQTMRGFKVRVGADGCYALTVNYRTLKWAAKPGKHC